MVSTIRRPSRKRITSVRRAKRERTRFTRELAIRHANKSMIRIHARNRKDGRCMNRSERHNTIRNPIKAR